MRVTIDICIYINIDTESEVEAVSYTYHMLDRVRVCKALVRSNRYSPSTG